MANGGYQAPGKPAAVSGPGKMSQRTDNPQVEALANNYGEGVSMQALRKDAPVQPPRKQTVQPSRGGGGGGAMPEGVIGFDQPTMNPGEPITSGVDLGDGPGTEALGLPQGQEQTARADVAQMHPGFIEAMVRASMSKTATPSFKKYVRSLLANR
jgi:hypothetical protein